MQRVMLFPRETHTCRAELLTRTQEALPSLRGCVLREEEKPGKEKDFGTEISLVGMEASHHFLLVTHLRAKKPSPWESIMGIKARVRKESGTLKSR